MRFASSSLSRARGRATLVFTIAAAGVLLVAAIPAARADAPVGAADPAVINTWNTIAVGTVAGPAPNGAGKANAEAFLWFGFVQAAVYNAVNGITGEYELYKWNAKAPKGASPQAAAAVAAHGVLMEYFGTGDFPNSESIAANLNGALATSLAQVPDGVSQDQGVRYGERAAEHIVRLRENDGRFAPVVFNPPNPTAPGVWRPTPPGFFPFFDPWLGQMKPLMLDSASQFLPGPPPTITSDLYFEEFEEVRDYGVNVGSLRTVGPSSQTETALFFSDIGVGPIQAGLRDFATRRALDISDRARLFAAVDMSQADTLFSVWNAKYYYGWWRPVTAIREADTDGNDDTVGVPGWTSFIVNPPYPDWPSGLTGIIGVTSTALTLLHGGVDLNLTSTAAGVTRHYTSASSIQQDVIDARVWSGIHFRTADVTGVAMGTNVASWALARYFAPTN